MSLKEDACYVLTVEHFSGNITQVIGVFTDLEKAKEIQRSYDSLNRVYVTIYRAPLFTEQKTRSAKDVSKAKPRRSTKAKGDGDAPKEE